MKTNKIIAFLAITILALSSLGAEGSKVKQPKKGNVLVVGKLAYKKPIDIAGREKAFREYGYKKYAKEEGLGDFSITPDFSNKLIDNVTDELEGYFYQEIKVKKDGKLHLDTITVRLFTKSSFYYAFKLPVNVTINVPDDAVYVYIGTLEYDLDYALRMIGFRHLDEFEEAEKNLSRTLGFEAELSRAALEFDKTGSK